MKRLCFIVNNFDVGGLEKVVISLINHIDRSQFDIHVICLAGRGKLFEQISVEKDKVLIIDKKAGIDLSAIFAVKRFLKSRKIEIVHAHNFGPLIYTGLAVRLMLWGRPLVIYSEHNQVYRQIKSGVLKTRFYISLADRIVTVSDKLKQFYQDELGVTKGIETIYNGICGVSDDDEVVSRLDLSLRDTDFVFGTAVVLTEQKGIIYLLEAAAELRDSANDIKIIIAGDGPLKQMLERYSRENGLSDMVQFIGYRSDVHNLLKMFDVYVLPSLWEGLPLALLEAMSAGKPVIATDVGGNAEIVEHKVNGLVVNAADSKALGRAMMDIYQAREELGMYQDVNKEKFTRMFSLDSMILNHERLYSSLSR